MAYDEVMGGGKKEISLLDISGENEDIWHNNSKVLAGTHLNIFNKENNKEIEVVSLKKLVEH